MSDHVLPEASLPWLSLVAGLTVLALGVSLFSRRLAAAAGAGHAHRDHHDGGDGGVGLVRVRPLPVALAATLGALAIAAVGGVLTARALESFPGAAGAPERVDGWLAGVAVGNGLAPVALAAVLLGLRHATDPDHLAAIATLAVAGEGRNRAGGIRLGAAWGAGHAATLLAFGLPIVLVDGFLPDAAQRGAEALVGVMIVALALRLLWRAGRGAFHAHEHTHVLGGATVEHRHGHSTRTAHGHRLARTPWQAFSIGLVHGIGGSAGVGILLLAAIPGQATAVLALVLFAALTAASMALLSSGLGVAIGGRRARRAFDRVAPAVGVVSLLFGCWYLLGALELAAYPL